MKNDTEIMDIMKDWSIKKPSTLTELKRLYHKLTNELSSGYFGRIGDNRQNELREMRFWTIHTLEHDNRIFNY